MGQQTVSNSFRSTNDDYQVEVEDQGGGVLRQVVKVAPTVLTPEAPDNASVGTSSAEVLASNSSRIGLVLVNTSANGIFLGLGVTAETDKGIYLAPSGGAWTMTPETCITDSINAIATGASSNLAIQEFTS